MATKAGWGEQLGACRGPSSGALLLATSLAVALLLLLAHSSWAPGALAPSLRTQRRGPEVGGTSQYVYGLVHKAGPPPQHLFHPNYTHACHADRKAWIQALNSTYVPAAELPNGTARLNPLGRPWVDPRVPPCQACQVWVNHEYRVMYVRHAKSGSTTVLNHFGRCLVPAEQGPACLDFFGFSNDGQWRPLNMTDEEAAALWADYFVFTVMRDPFDRAVSGYHWLMRTVAPEPMECRTLMDWDTYCDNPLSISRMCVERSECCSAAVTWFLLHHMEQGTCTMAAGGGLAVDFIARVEQLADDLNAVIDIINKRRAPGVAPLAPYAATSDNVNRQRCDPSESRLLASHYEAEMVGSIDTNKWVGLVAKEQYCSTAEFYQGRHAHCYAGVAEFYRSDLDVLLGAGRVK